MSTRGIAGSSAEDCNRSAPRSQASRAVQSPFREPVLRPGPWTPRRAAGYRGRGGSGTGVTPSRFSTSATCAFTCMASPAGETLRGCWRAQPAMSAPYRTKTAPRERSGSREPRSRRPRPILSHRADNHRPTPRCPYLGKRAGSCSGIGAAANIARGTLAKCRRAERFGVGSVGGRVDGVVWRTEVARHAS